VFITLEDELGHIPLVVWPQEYEKFKQVLREPVLLMRGVVSRRDDTFNIVVKEVRPVPMQQRNLPKAKNWQ
jgi:error-prone DNA polymerase